MIDRKEKLNQIERAQYLNSKFKAGVPAFEELKTIRSFAKPIVVDYNNVLVDTEGKNSNPEAIKFLPELRNLGTIFVITTATSWETVSERLRNYRLFHNEMVLMVRNNWGFMFTYESTSRLERYSLPPHLSHKDSRVAKLVEDFVELQQQSGNNYRPEDFTDVVAATKRVAPIFGKSFKVPILDDSTFIKDNPGMLPIQLAPFEPNPVYLENWGGKSWEEAVDLVRQHYSKIH